MDDPVRAAFAAVKEELDYFIPDSSPGRRERAFIALATLEAELERLRERVVELEADAENSDDQWHILRAERDSLKAQLVSGGRCSCGHLNESCDLPALSPPTQHAEVTDG